MKENENYWTRAESRRYSRRSILRIVAGLGASYAGLSVIGCSGQKPSPEASGAKAAKAPKYGGSLNWFNPGTLPHLDPYDFGGRTGQRAITTIIYEFLVDYDWSGDLTMADDKLIPVLAQSWTMPDETTYLFKLRQGVKWHDGVEFTSADVQFSFDFVMDAKNNLDGRSLLSQVKKVEAPDKNTIKVTLAAPSAAFLSMLTNQALVIVPKHLLEKDRTALAMKPVGTGPFILEKFDPKTGATLKKNPNYWVPGKPYLDGMNMSLIDDWSAKAAAFMSKQIDAHVVGDKPQLDAIKAAVPDLIERPWPGVNNTTCELNYARPPFNDIRVRRAFHLIIDRKAMVDIILGGEGIINSPAIPAVWKKWAIPQEELLKMPGWRQPKDQDIAEAKRLLAEAGYANGLKLVGIARSQAATGPKILEVMAEQMRKVGIIVDQQNLETTIATKRLKAGDFDFYLVPFGGSSEDPDRRFAPYYHSTGVSNNGRLNDPKLDEMIEKQGRMLNEQERRKIILDIQRYMIEQSYHPPTIDPIYYGMTHPYVNGFDLAYSGTLQPYPRGESQDFWLDK